MIKHLLLVLFIGLTSCGIYRQTVVNAPLMEQKGQTQLSGHIGFNGLEGQAAYAITNKIAVLANYADMGVRKEQNTSTNYEIWKHNFKEIGAGLYKKMPSGKTRELFIFAGKGMTSHFVMGKNSAGLVSPTIRKADYSRFTVQADLGGKESKFEYALSPRLMAVSYDVIMDDTGRDFRNPSHFHIYSEGAITIRYPLLKFLMISGQVCGTLPLTHPGIYDYYYEFSPLSGSIGLMFNIHLLKPNR